MSTEEKQEVKQEEVKSDEQQEKEEKSWLDVYESQTEWRAIRGDSFVVNKEAAAGTFELVCRVTGNVLYCEVAGKLVEVYHDEKPHTSLETAMHEGRKTWAKRDELLRAALKSSKTTSKGKREKVSLAEKAAEEVAAAATESVAAAEQPA